MLRLSLGDALQSDTKGADSLVLRNRFLRTSWPMIIGRLRGEYSKTLNQSSIFKLNIVRRR